MMGQWMAMQAMALWRQAAPGGSSPLAEEQFRQQMALEALRHHGPPNGVAILVPLGFFALIVLIVWLVHRSRQAKIRAQAEFHKQLLDKFGSGQEFAAFLESKGSQRFLDEMWARGRSTRDRMLRSMNIGIVVTALGLGILGVSAMNRHVLGLGIIVLAIGVGYLIATFVTYRLSKRWGQAPESGAANT